MENEHIAHAPTDTDRLERKRFRQMLLNTLSIFMGVCAAAVLIAFLWLPVLHIHGSSMAPTLQEDDLILAVRTTDFSPGDLMCFYYNNKILVKRVIATPGDTVDLQVDGSVWVNGEKLDEPYVEELDYGDVSVTFPCQVPADRYFVLGDQRSNSVDSRSSAVGMIPEDLILGKIILRFWPLPELEILS